MSSLRKTTFNLPYKKGTGASSKKKESLGTRVRKALFNSTTFTILVIVVTAIAFFAGAFNAIEWKGVLATIITMGMLTIRVAFYVVQKREEGFTSNRPETMFMVVPSLLALVMAFIASTVVYDVGFLALFAADWTIQLYWFVGLEVSCAIVILLFNLIRDWYSQEAQKFWNDLVLLFVAVVPLVLLIFNTQLATLDPGVTFIVIIVIMSVLLVAWVWKLPKEVRVRAGLVYGGMAFAFTLLIVMFYNPFAPSAVVEGFVPIIGGQEAPVNYFSYIWYIFFQSPAAAIMIAIMTFGTTVNLFVATLGGAEMLRGLGVLIMVFPPMLIILEMWTGGIQPPSVLTEILGLGVAAPIFAICETGVFAIMAGLLGYFGGYAKLLQQRFNIPQF